MSFFFTKVPTQWSPRTAVKLPGGITLKPANRVPFRNYPGLGSTMYFDTLHFISQAQSIEEHIEKLKRWALFHAFIFNDEHICNFFENGQLQRHRQKSSIGSIRRYGTANANAVDFTNIARQVYWLHEPTTVIDYRTLYEQFDAFNDANMSLLRTYLLRIEQRRFMYQQYSLFTYNRIYWQIAVYAAVLEAIIGHANNCPHNILACCIDCKKEYNLHREKSEREWRDIYLTRIADQNIKGEYSRVITVAYNEIRHPTAHAGVMPIPTYPLQSPGTETYDVDRSISEFKLNEQALESLLLLIKDITRYLLLERLFQLNIFPPLNPLFFIRIAPGV